MADPRHPLAPDEDPDLLEDDADPEGHYISPGSAMRFRRLTWLLVFFILALGANAVAAFDARRNATDALHASEQETQARIRQNTENARENCLALNKVARSVKVIVAGTGASLTQADVDRIRDPELHALVQAIVDRSDGNQDRLRAQGDAIPIQDCAAQAAKAKDAK